LAGTVAATFLGGVFLLAALGKWDAWAAWQSTLETIFSSPLGRSVVKYGVPASELALALVTLFFLPFHGVIVCGIALVGLAIGVYFMSKKYEGTKCACFGAFLPSSLSRALAVRNLLLAAVAFGSVLAFDEATFARPGVALLLCLFSGLLVVQLASEYQQFRRAPSSLQEESA
jgi:hypothetical protein